jgi:hypothetical protein
MIKEITFSDKLKAIIKQHDELFYRWQNHEIDNIKTIIKQKDLIQQLKSLIEEIG